MRSGLTLRGADEGSLQFKQASGALGQSIAHETLANKSLSARRDCVQHTVKSNLMQAFSQRQCFCGEWMDVRREITIPSCILVRLHGNEERRRFSILRRYRDVSIGLGMNGDLRGLFDAVAVPLHGRTSLLRSGTPLTYSFLLPARVAAPSRGCNATVTTSSLHPRIGINRRIEEI